MATESVVQLGSVPAPTVPTTNQVSSEEKHVAHDAQMDALMGKLANFGDLAGPENEILYFLYSPKALNL